jgi:hypothetical protein
MRLPRFTAHVGLNSLRQQMGAPGLGDLTLVQSDDILTIDDLNTLITGGIDIQDLSEVVMLPDRSLVYKGRRVLLYIRDVPVFNRRPDGPAALPKFHVSNCTTLREMRSKKRYSRYVVAAREDGSFLINLIQDSVTTGAMERLNVCQNCLGELAYEHFAYEMNRNQRRAIVEAFTVGAFFKKFPRDLVTGDGLEGESSARINDYTGDFGQHALAVKTAANWICQSCLENLGAPHLRKFLHAHHVNGIKYDNSSMNLLALCILCHACQPGHTHMHAHPALREYRALGR